MSSKGQFFTTDTTDGEEVPFAIDHFYFRFEDGAEICLDAVGSVVTISMSGGTLEKFLDYPSALRRMANLIEKY